MASNREEKLQMRQRGAAQRKIKEVDFGFSLGLGLGTETEAPSQPLSQPTNFAEAPTSRQTNSAPENTRSSPKNRLSNSPNQSDQQVPGSARNRRPRPSTFDIPLDEEPEQRRTSKRRRIESPSEAQETSTGQDSIQIENSSQPLQNGSNASATKSHHGESSENDVQHKGRPTRAISDATIVPEPEISNREQKESGDRQPEVNGRGSADKETPQLENQLPSGHVNGRLRNSASETNGTPSNAPSPEITPPSDANAKRRTTGPSIDDHALPDNAANEATTAPEQSQQVEPPQGGPSPGNGKTQIFKPQHGKRRRGRQSSSPPSNRDRPDDHEGNKVPSADTGPAQTQQSQSRRGKNGKESGPLSETSASSGEPEGKTHAKVNRSQADSKDTSQSKKKSQSQQPKQSKKAKTKKSARRHGDQGSPQSVPNEPQLEPEPEQDQRERSAEPSRADNRRRGRARPKKGDSTTTPENEGPTQEAREGNAQPARRKTRARGETVPVTVHRLANVAMLAGDGDSSAGEESADELSTNRAIKLPNRGGVNPADVLSQVCRETLEKTLTTLKNAISNETHPARRSEIVRKTEAVEAYGAELEGRLLEMSETLDNNYVLGVQTKRAKREVNDLRGRLYQIRKERQEVAVQMDEVRRKHAEDLSLRVTRSTINNSLHSLELALDRSQNRPTSEGPSGDHSSSDVTDGLEFMLRTVAESVSSTAPGARGGLLNTIKAFNTQLETTAEELGC
ncbi:hypothetical protein PHISCL_00490 [Aspergillus sclerotialis]|uniref:Inner kinetochore subunit AME1 domain-containing protein n=1 Tax=Aspergillus sclerotialis TaxID=2070753 RepID=A0A3A3A0I8_9EURO|nr:hypothetical protein PHISCL_00490 [Aspergillus sclerotialis]